MKYTGFKHIKHIFCHKQVNYSVFDLIFALLIYIIMQGASKCSVGKTRESS